MWCDRTSEFPGIIYCFSRLGLDAFWAGYAFKAGERRQSANGVPMFTLTLGRPAPTPLVSDTPSFKITSKITLSTLYAFPIGQKVVNR